MDHTTPDAPADSPALGPPEEGAVPQPDDRESPGQTGQSETEGFTEPERPRPSVFRQEVDEPDPAVRPLDPEPLPSGSLRPADRINLERREPTRPERDRYGATIFVGLAAGIVGAAVTVAVISLAGVLDRPETVVEQVVAPAQPPAQIIVNGEASTTASAVAQKVVPSIVAVEVSTGTEGDATATFGSGSGVVLTSEGLIVTNHHVIADADVATVVLQNGVIYTAEIVGSDPVTDLAVLSIDASGLTPIELGDTSGLAIGDQAVAVGNPLGLPGGASVTVGVVSAFDREVTVGTGANDRLFGMLQTDAPITRGSSGGALVDGKGRLIGITTAIGITADAGAEGVGFAIPVELVTRITDEIIEKGNVKHTFLGVLLQDNYDEIAGAQVPDGAMIVDFVDPSGARDAGLEVGDVLTMINGLTVHTKEDIINELREFRVGDTVTFEVIRDDTTMVVSVVLGERPEDI